MTPDEVVEAFNLELNRLKGYLEIPEMEIHHGERMRKMVEALHSSITLIQDYQKLRERVSVERIKKELDDEHWHIINTNLAKRIVTYLQQPTEH